MIFSRIKARARAACGWSSTDDVSNTRLEEAINWAYTRHIPHDINYQGLQDWVYFDLADGISSYPFDTYGLSASGGSVIGTRIRSLIPPAVMAVSADDAAKINYTYDHDSFWEEYPPHTNESEGQPIIILEKARVLYPRPIPDTSYVIRIMANLRPAELSGDNDSPVEDWAEMIIPASIAHILEDDEDMDAGYWWGVYEQRKGSEVANDQSKPLGRTKMNW